jgi:hypothetical protein
VTVHKNKTYGNEMKKIICISVCLLFLTGCSSEDRFTPKDLKNVVTSAAMGNKSANDSLSGLFKMNPPPGKIRKLSVDTVTITGRLFYGVAAEFSNPLNNRFALYDEYLNCFIIDRSLNGTLQIDALNQIDLKYFTLDETFYSNDNIELKRFSIFRGDTSGFDLAFRTFTMMKTSDTVFMHNLYEITPEMIRTNISAPIYSGINNLNDDYMYDDNLKIYYVRKAIYFDEYVKDFINSIKDTSNKFIKPTASYMNEAVDELFQFTSSETPEYYINLGEGWKELRNKPGEGILKKYLTGSKFVNDKLGSNIFVFKIPFMKDTEDYIKVKLENVVNGKYTVRYSKEYSEDNYIRKYFEYSCNTQKYLLLLSAAKETFPENKQEYYEIINTFYIDC